MGRFAPRGRVAALVVALVLVAGTLPAGVLAAAPSGPTSGQAAGASPAAAPARTAPRRTPVARTAEHVGTVNARAAAKASQLAPSRNTRELPFLRATAPRSDAGAAAGTASPKAATREGASVAAAQPVGQTSNPPLFVAQSWEGINQATSGYEPPDPWVAVGPEHVVQSVNTRIQIWNRTGDSKLAASLDAATFFQLDAPVGPLVGLSDPRFLYDSVHGRFVATAVSWDCASFDVPLGYWHLLVSRTGDPTGAWDHWWYDYEAAIPDYPAAGWSTDKIGIATNVFEIDENCDPTGGYYGTDISVFDWSTVLAAPADLPFAYFDPLGSEFTGRVATQLPATSPTLHVVSVTNPVNVDDPINVIYGQITGSVAAKSIVWGNDHDLGAAKVLDPLVPPPAPQQPGPSTVTTRVDERITDAIWKDNLLRIVATSGCTPSGDTTMRACVHVAELRTNGVTASTPPAVTQDFLIGKNATDNFFGGVGVSGDNTLHVVWTRSSTTAPDGYPSSMHAYRLASDPANQLSAPVTVAAGTAQYQGARWGDYVGVAQDPQVPNAIWQANQYSGGTWKTRVTQLQGIGASYVPIAPVRVLDTRATSNVGLQGKFKADTPRSWKVGGFNGGQIPSNAVAVTGNVTVVNQSTVGFIAVTTIPTATPGSSTLNFPLADIRANNVTAVLRSNGELSAVFKGGTGSADLVFDVTGYFVAGPNQARYNTFTPFRRIDSRNGTGMPGGTKKRFVFAEPQTFQIAGNGSVPTGAIAVTGNLTVVGQTRQGFLAITKDATATPSTSTLNFPLGDIRANGFTAPLNATGKLSIVYAGAVKGSTTDVVLDLTGYYTKTGGGMVFHPLNAGRIFDTRTTGNLTGLNKQFLTQTPAQLTAAGHWGVGKNAGAITGNLTVTEQAKAGYVGVTLTSQAVPSTSSLNFPVKDNRANGITVPLDNGGKTWLVYVSGDPSTGNKTHLLLDVTGYFAGP